jgi:hypothetical protein
MITENYIRSLLFDDYDFQHVIDRLEKLNRSKAPGLEKHHIEPERKRVIWLKPLEHLAIHIAHARIEQSSSYYAKVASFVKMWPGSYRRSLGVSPKLKEELISFGQKRPGAGHLLNLHPNTIAAKKTKTKKQKEAAAKNGRKGAEKVRQALLGRQITWGNKISQKLLSFPMCSCIYCGKEMKALPSNITQHQNGKKCLKNSLPKQRKNSTAELR